MITVRPAKFSDAEIIADFQKMMALETEDLKLDAEILKKGVAAVFDDSSKGTFYMACDNEDAIACMLTTPEWSEWRNGTVMWIQSVYVIENYRGKGVFKKMYHFLKQMIEQDDRLMGLRLYVEKKNVAAQKVYKALGMHDEHYNFYEWMKTF